MLPKKLLFFRFLVRRKVTSYLFVICVQSASIKLPVHMTFTIFAKNLKHIFFCCNDLAYLAIFEIRMGQQRKTPSVDHSTPFSFGFLFH